MKKKPEFFQELKEVLENDCGVLVSKQEAKEAAGNLVNFFDLLWQFDQEDRQKERQMEVKQDGKRIQNSRFI